MRLDCTCAAAYGPHAHCRNCGTPIHPAHPCNRCFQMALKLGDDGLRWLEKVIDRRIDEHVSMHHGARKRKRS